jgi:quercetin dioxygenase-like cupin family protein
MSNVKDLTREAPRGTGDTLDGYAWLPRMLDKARATLAGTAGDYLFGCPVDHTCLARLGVPPEVVLDLAERYDDDNAVLDALRAHGITPAEDAWFDAEALEDELQRGGTYLRVRHRDALPKHGQASLFEGAEHGADMSVAVIDAEPGASEEPHAHKSPEVVVVQHGEATFFLGKHQARTVRAGEIVRIPARTLHGWRSSGRDQLIAVEVHSGSPRPDLES